MAEVKFGLSELKKKLVFKKRIKRVVSMMAEYTCRHGCTPISKIWIYTAAPFATPLWKMRCSRAEVSSVSWKSIIFSMHNGSQPRENLGKNCMVSWFDTIALLLSLWVESWKIWSTWPPYFYSYFNQCKALPFAGEYKQEPPYNITWQSTAAHMISKCDTKSRYMRVDIAQGHTTSITL